VPKKKKKKKNLIHMKHIESLQQSHEEIQAEERG
jgi:hypothetical protein